MRKRNDRPILADELIAGCHQTGGIEHLQNLRDPTGRHGSMRIDFSFFLDEDLLMYAKGNTKILWCQDHEASAGKILDEPIRLCVGDL